MGVTSSYHADDAIPRLDLDDVHDFDRSNARHHGIHEERHSCACSRRLRLRHVVCGPGMGRRGRRVEGGEGYYQQQEAHRGRGEGRGLGWDGAPVKSSAVRALSKPLGRDLSRIVSPA